MGWGSLRRHHHQEIAHIDLLPDGAEDLTDRARSRRSEGVLHLHGLEHDEGISLDDGVALGHQDLGDGARKRCPTLPGQAALIVRIVSPRRAKLDWPSGPLTSAA